MTLSSPLNSPVFATLQANLLHALAPFPEARMAVVNAFRQMDKQNAPLMRTIEHIPLAESATRVADSLTISQSFASRRGGAASAHKATTA